MRAPYGPGRGPPGHAVRPREGPAGPLARRRPLRPAGCPGLRPWPTLMCLDKFEFEFAGRWPRQSVSESKVQRPIVPVARGFGVGAGAAGWVRLRSRMASLQPRGAGLGLNAGAGRARGTRCGNGPGQALAHLPLLARAAAAAAGGRGEQSKGPGDAKGHGHLAWVPDGSVARGCAGAHAERPAQAHARLACPCCCLIVIRGGLAARGVGGGVSY